MIHIVLGTKAQLIKMAPVMKELTLRGISYNYISTGQHKETIDDILNNFQIKQPDIKLYSGKDITSILSMSVWSVRILVKSFINRKKIFNNDKKGIVLVHGDTLSTVIGALMGKSAGLKVGHVESGLRSFNLFQPFPEEIFRKITFNISDVMFCPGKWAVDNLKKYSGIKIDTGLNTLYDSLNHAGPSIGMIGDVNIPEVPFVIATIHRFENVRNAEILGKIVDLIGSVSEKFKLIFILHKITEKKLKKFRLLDKLGSLSNIELRPRYDYFRFIKLLKSSEFVISDGGSNQEECSYLGKPVLLFRNVTERNEGLGTNAVLSEFDPNVVADFMKNYESMTGNAVKTEKSPSAVITDYCIDFK